MEGPGSPSSSSSNLNVGETVHAVTNDTVEISEQEFSRDWGEMDPDLLREISKKLGDISVVIRFRVVCKHWRSSIRPCDCPPQLPWFLRFSRPLNTLDVEFFSLYSKRTHTLHLPQGEREPMLGAKSRYLSINNDVSTSFLNPFTRSRFHLPYEEFSRSGLILMGFTSAEDCDVAIFYEEEEPVVVMVFLECDGGVKTKRFETPDLGGDDVVAYCKGKLFLSAIDTTSVINVDNGDVELVIPEPGFGSIRCLVEACGEILAVAINRVAIDNELKVYRLEEGGGINRNPIWVKVTDGIGDRMLFLSDWSRGGFCLEAGDFDDGITGNCVYFKTYVFTLGFVLARYDLETNEKQLLPLSTQAYGFCQVFISLH